MYRIVIAHDKNPELIALYQNLEESLDRSSIVRIVDSGRAAVEAALFIHADLVILDAEALGRNGLEVADVISNKLPDCKVMMLTACHRFEYEKEAVSSDSESYLLKTSSCEALGRAVDSALRKIDGQRAEKEEKERSKKWIQTLSLQIEEQIARAAMGGETRSTDIFNRMQNYGVTFRNGVFSILYSPNRNHSSGIVMAVKGKACPEGIHSFAYCYESKVYILYVSSDEKLDSSKAVQTPLTALSQAAQTLWGLPLFTAVGQGFSNLSEASLSCLQAQDLLNQCTVDRPMSVYCGEGGQQNAKWSAHPIIRSILFGEVERMNQAADSLVCVLSAQQLEFEAFIVRLNSNLARIVQSLRAQTGFPIFDDPVISVTERSDIEALKYEVASCLCRIANQLLAQDAGRLYKVKNEIEWYVAYHYPEELFLSDIARAMNYSSGYFSKLFKQCFQRSFVSYLTEVRIKAAKDLMKRTELTIREIGEKVGYKDPNYFAKVFRKSVGVSPSKYREIPVR